MKKILIFGYTLEMGGAERELIDTVNYLVKENFDIDLFLLEKKGALLNEISDKVNVYQIKTNIFSYLMFRYIPLIRKNIINKISLKKEYDYAVGYMEGRAATWVCDIKKEIVKYAWIHSDVSKFNIGISDKETKKTYNNLNKIICVSEPSKINFCNKYNISPDKVIVIHNYINENDILKKANEFKINNAITTFVNVAKMRNEKRQDRIINVAKYLKDKKYKFKFQLIGDGPNFLKISNLVKELDVSDCVELLGLKENPYPYIKNCDYFILTSEQEGYGIVIKEALLLKKKVISTNTVGAATVLENGKYGFIVENDDEKLKFEIENILKDSHKLDYLESSILNYENDNEKIKEKIISLFEGDQRE